MGTNILKLYDICIPEQLPCGLITAVWILQNTTQYFPLLGFVEEVLKSLALLSFNEPERYTVPRKIWIPKITGLNSRILNWDISFSVCRAMLSDLCCIPLTVSPSCRSLAALLSPVLIPFFFHFRLGFLCLGQNFCLEWCKQTDAGLPKPDLILFLQLSPEEAAARGNFGGERYENGAFQEKVLQSFRHLMKEKTLNWKVRN